MNAKMPKIERKEEKGHLTRGGCREEKVEEKKGLVENGKQFLVKQNAIDFSNI